MSSRTLIFGSLAVLAVLAGALIFAALGDRSADPRAVADGADHPGMVAAPGSLDADTTREPRAAEDSDADPDAGVDGLGPAVEGSAPPTAERPAEPAAERPTRDAQADRAAAGAARPGTAAGAPSSQDPDVDAILRATSRRYEDVRSIQAEFRQVIRNPLLGSEMTSRGTLYQRQPDRFLMRFSDPEGDIIVSDGEHFWLYFPSTDARQVIRSRRGAEGLDLRSQFVGDPVRRFESTYHGREDVAGRAAHVLTLEPREPLGYRRLKVWIDAGDHLVRRFELTEDSGLVRHFTLTDLRINPTLGDQLFRFSPPANARVVDRG